jgi:hypothetical protein
MFDDALGAAPASLSAPGKIPVIGHLPSNLQAIHPRKIIGISFLGQRRRYFRERSQWLNGLKAIM